MKCLAGCYLVTVERVSIIYFFQVSSKVCKKKVKFFFVKKELRRHSCEFGRYEARRQLTVSAVCLYSLSAVK